jgi:CRP/FNR family transcriptional regulator
MLSPLQKAEFSRLFPFINQATAEFAREFFTDSQYVELPAGVSICDEGENCSHLALVMAGNGRVYKLSPSGREITLYRVNPGESCVLTASCIMNQSSFPAMAQSETPMRGVLISPSRVRDWFCRDDQWQRFIFGLLSHRLADIISVVEEVAFKRIDVRLADYFVRYLQGGHTTINKTHADLAADVGSSREVVSRILRDFSQRQLIRSGRGQIDIVDPEGLTSIALQ